MIPPSILGFILAWISYYDSTSLIDSIRVKVGKHSWVHLGMDLGYGFGMEFGHDSWTRIESKLHGFWGIVRGGFWQDFEGNAWNKFDGNSGKILG